MCGVGDGHSGGVRRPVCAALTRREATDQGVHSIPHTVYMYMYVHVVL